MSFLKPLANERGQFFGGLMEGFGGGLQNNMLRRRLTGGVQQQPPVPTIETEGGLDLPVGQFQQFSPLKQLLTNLGIMSPSRF